MIGDIFRNAGQWHGGGGLYAGFLKRPETRGRQMVCVGADHAAFLAGKRAAIIDDVVSTGGSIDAVKEVLKKVGASYDIVYAAFTEGGERQNVIALGDLPFPYPI